MKDLTLFQILSIEVMGLYRDVKQLNVKLVTGLRTQAELCNEYKKLKEKYADLRRRKTKAFDEMDTLSWAAIDDQCLEISSKIDDIWRKLYMAF